jgi:peptide chain release factor 3
MAEVRVLSNGTCCRRRSAAAAKSAVMVLDAAKGVEPQTRRLFEGCSRRGIPIFTFINKMDRPARDPLALLDEIEDVLGMQPAPMNWPLGDGPEFRGLVDRASGEVYLYERSVRNEQRAGEMRLSLAELRQRGLLREGRFERVQENLALLDALDIEFDPDRVAAKATFEEPKQYPEGIDYVLVNGQLVIDNGAHTGAMSGRALRSQ